MMPLLDGGAEQGLSSDSLNSRQACQEISKGVFWGYVQDLL